MWPACPNGSGSSPLSQGKRSNSSQVVLKIFVIAKPQSRKHAIRAGHILGPAVKGAWEPLSQDKEDALHLHTPPTPLWDKKQVFPHQTLPTFK